MWRIQFTWSYVHLNKSLINKWSFEYIDIYDGIICIKMNIVLIGKSGLCIT